MAQQYGKIDSALVDHHHFRALSKDAKIICLHARITHRNNAIGCYYYPASHISDDTDIDFEDTKKALQELEARAFLLYCHVTRWVWIPKYLEHFPVKGKNSGKHAFSVLETVPRDFAYSDSLVAVFEENHDWENDKNADEIDEVWKGIRRTFEAPSKGITPRAISTTTTTPTSTTTPTTTPNQITEAKASDSSEPQATLEPAVMTFPLVKKDGEFQITQRDVDEWSESFPAIDVLSWLRRIRQWNIDNPSKRKTRRGIRNHISGWLAKEQDRGGPRPANGRTSTLDHNMAAADEARGLIGE